MFTVLDRVSVVNYRIKVYKQPADRNNKTEIKIVNVRRLKPHTDANTISKIAHELGIEPDKVMAEFANLKSMEADAAQDEEPEFEVETVLAKKMIRGNLYYLVKWKGYSNDENTWEPLEHLSNAADIVTTFDYNYEREQEKKSMVDDKKKGYNTRSRK